MKRKLFSKLLIEIEKDLANINYIFPLDTRSKLYADGVYRDLKVLKKYLPSGKILDFGCGIGNLSVIFSSIGFEVQGVEIDAKVPSIHWFTEMEWYKKKQVNEKIWRVFEKKYNLSLKIYDGYTLPFKDDSFDAVIAYAVMEHIADNLLSVALNEIYRVTKPNGIFFIFRTPRKRAYTEKISRSHNKLIDEKELIMQLNKHDFELVIKKRTDFFPAFLPGKFQKILNFLSPLLFFIQNILDTMPTNIISHNLSLVLRKK